MLYRALVAPSGDMLVESDTRCPREMIELLGLVLALSPRLIAEAGASDYVRDAGDAGGLRGWIYEIESHGGPLVGWELRAHVENDHWLHEIALVENHSLALVVLVLSRRGWARGHRSRRDRWIRPPADGDRDDEAVGPPKIIVR